VAQTLNAADHSRLILPTDNARADARTRTGDPFITSGASHVSATSVASLFACKLTGFAIIGSDRFSAVFGSGVAILLPP
jgi:hypothetical protein